MTQATAHTDIEALAKGLSQSPSGIWHALETQAVSFPESQTLKKFQIQDASFWYRHRNACIIETLRRFPPSGLIMDVGGGNGYVAQGIQNAGFETAVLEPSLTGIQNAATRNIPHLICATWQTAHFQDNKLPAIGLFDVIEHIEDDTSLLSDIFSALTPKGRLYLTVPAHPALWSAVDTYSGHFRRYSQRELQAKLEHAGFEIEYTTTFFKFLTPPIFLLRALPTYLGLLKPEKITDTTQDDQASPFFNAIFNWFGKREQRAIEEGRQMHLGTSHLCVARKVASQEKNVP